MARNRVLELLCGPVGRRVFSPLMQDRATIFVLHRVQDERSGVRGHSIEFVFECLQTLRATGAQFVSLRSLIERWRSGLQVDPNSVAFTIDDGFADQPEFARQVFLPMKCPVTMFLISGFLDRALWPWDDQLAYAFSRTTLPATELTIGSSTVQLDLSTAPLRSAAMRRVRDLCKQIPNEDIYSLVQQIAGELGTSIPSLAPPQYQPMSWDTARELEQLGVEFGPHSVTHRVCSKLSQSETHKELSESWARLKQELTNPLPVFAWPTGRHSDFSAKDITLARELGLHACVATESDYAHVRRGDLTALYALRRFGLPTQMSNVLYCGSGFERAKQVLSPGN